MTKDLKSTEAAQKQPREVFYKKAVLKNFATFTRKCRNTFTRESIVISKLHQLKIFSFRLKETAVRRCSSKQVLLKISQGDT